MNEPLNRKLRMGLIGGAAGSFIGRVHATAAVLDNRAKIVAGALSSNPQKSRDSAASYDIAPARAYGSYAELLERESNLPADQRIDFVSVATPNHTHFEISKAAVEAGFHVICDKPLTLNVEQAERLGDLVDSSGVVFGVTHNYTGYPLVRQVRQMIREGELGEICAIRVSYIQGWLRARLESGESAGSIWRTDPNKSGAAGCFGDIGTHAFNLARYMTGLMPSEISCQMGSFVQKGPLDEYGTAIIRFENGALGTLTASQITAGRENDLSIEIDGSKGAVQWRQETPNTLMFQRSGEAKQIYSCNPRASYMNAPASDACRIPGGHPEGFLEAFANVYRSVFDDICLHSGGAGSGGAGSGGAGMERRDTVYPNIHDGIEGMYFIQQSVASSRQGGAWLPLKHARARS